MISSALLCLVMLTTASEAAPPLPHPSGDAAEVWVLGGQSNMFGSASLPEVPLPPVEDVLMFNMDNTWIPAQDPIHRIFEADAPVFHQMRLADGMTEEQYQAARVRTKEKPIGGVGPGFFFARHLHAHLQRPIGLIPNAPGGSSMAHWSPDLRDKGGDSLYGAMIERIERVGGDIAGVLWYQGEGEAFSSETAEAYPKALAHFVDSLRKDTGIPDLPIIIVQISRFTRENDPVFDRNWELVREGQRRIMSERKNVYFVSTIDLPLTDQIHLNYAGQERLGRRLAELALSQCYGQESHGRPIDFAGLELLDGDTDRPRIRVRFSGVTGQLGAPGRPTGFEIRFPEAKAQVPQIFRVDFDPGDPAAVLLNIHGSLPEGPMELIYGAGMNPYVNIVDEADIPIPAFGPLPVRNAAGEEVYTKAE